MMRLSLLMCVAPSLVGALRRKTNRTRSSIVNGTVASECEWTWQVGLSSTLRRSVSCGGVLIGSQWVLTAASCFGDERAIGKGPTRAVAGTSDVYMTDSTAQNRKVEQVFRHPKFRTNRGSRVLGTVSYSIMFGNDHDFALVKLDTPFEMGKCVNTVRLPRAGADVAPGTKCMITGWGTLAAGDLLQPRRLHQGEVTTMSDEACVKSYRDFGRGISQVDPHSSLCAQGKTKEGKFVNACNSDRGGPLVCQENGQWTVFGVTTWQADFGHENGDRHKTCETERYPGVWARVHFGLGWIEATMAANP